MLGVYRYLYDSRFVLKHNQCTNGFCLQIKGENVRIKASRYEAQGILLNKYFPLYFTRTANNAILSGGYLLLHYISVSID